MSIKVYIHYDGKNGGEQKTSKIGVPKSWLTKNVSDIIGLFVDGYNKKNPEHILDVAEIHLADTDGNKICSDEVVSLSLGDHSDYHIKTGAYNQKKSVVVDNIAEGSVRCKNYGCNIYYKEEDNNDHACSHHTGPPIFHDTMKCWSCCRDKKAFDFEGFQEIKGCAMGRHSQNIPGVTISASPRTGVSSGSSVIEDRSNNPAPSSISDTVFSPVVKNIDDYNKANPTQVTAASSANKVLSTRKSTRSADGLTARCQRKGCQKQFNIADNTPTSCIFHNGQPIFHDAVKFWSCCPDKKCYDFDEFMAVKGCSIANHDDGEVDINNLAL